MKKFLIGLLALIGALAILAVIGALLIALVSIGLGGKPGVERGTIVEFDLSGPLVEWVPNDPVAALLLGETPTVRDVVDALDRAAEDRRVAGAFLDVGDLAVGFGRIQELRDAVARFRASGKPIVAWSDTFGEFGAANGGYYLASACDRIGMQPSGSVGLTGLRIESQFQRGLYDLLDVEAEMGQRHEYKNAANVHTHTEFTEPHEEALAAVLTSLHGQMVRGVADGRGLDEDVVRELIDTSPRIGVDALDHGLVDALEYRDEAIAALRERAGDGPLLYHDRYVERAGRPHASGRDVVALVYGVGAVVRGSSGYDPLSGMQTMGSDDVAASLRDAADDDRVRAIVFRVDSPGGSYVASDTVWREVQRARDAGKPVVVSMGDVAASGGYFVSMHADHIVAQPGTITASIGVLAGKLATREAWKKIGITFDTVQVGDNADMWSALDPYDAAGRARLDAFLDGVYEDFTSRVADGRGLDRERVGEIARGRIWTGEDALALGLVDELGGVDVALRVARERAGLAPDGEVRFQVYPRPQTPFEALMDRGPDGSEGRAAVVALQRVLTRVRPLVRTLDRVGLGPGAEDVLSLPEPAPRP